jgi:hypothetical protein
MKTHSVSSEVLPPLRGVRLCLFAAAALVLLPACLWSVETPVAVFTGTFNGYQRTRLPDNSFKTETYAFGEGSMSGLDEPRPGKSELTFMRVARAAAVPLAQANYVPSSNPNETGLLITVFWGRTRGSMSPGTDRSFLDSAQNPAFIASTPRSTFGSPPGSSFKPQGGEGYKDTGLHSAEGKAAILDVSAAKQDALIEQPLWIVLSSTESTTATPASSVTARLFCEPIIIPQTSYRAMCC